MAHTRRFRKVGKGYSRPREKTITQTMLLAELPYDPLIPGVDVGGGDPGIALLMDLAPAHELAPAPGERLASART